MDTALYLNVTLIFRFSNLPGGAAPHRPVENGRPPVLPPVRPQQEALPRSSVVGPNDQFINTPEKGSFPNGMCIRGTPGDHKSCGQVTLN